MLQISEIVEDKDVDVLLYLLTYLSIGVVVEKLVVEVKLRKKDDLITILKLISSHLMNI